MEIHKNALGSVTCPSCCARGLGGSEEPGGRQPQQKGSLHPAAIPSRPEALPSHGTKLFSREQSSGEDNHHHPRRAERVGPKNPRKHPCVPELTMNFINSTTLFTA